MTFVQKPLLVKMRQHQRYAFRSLLLVDKAVTNNVDLPELLIMWHYALYQDNLDFIRYLNERV